MYVEIGQQPQSGIRFVLAPPPLGALHAVDSPGARFKQRTNFEELISTSMMLSIREGLWDIYFRRAIFVDIKHQKITGNIDDDQNSLARQTHVTI